MRVGSLIRDVRLAEGLTQAQLARRLGITQPSVARLESAGDAVTVATLRRTLIALGHDLQLSSTPLPLAEQKLRDNLLLSPAQRLALHEIHGGNASQTRG